MRVRAAVRVGRPLREEVVAPTVVALPVTRGQQFGAVRVYDRQRLVGTAPLVAAKSVPSPGSPRAPAGTRSVVRATRRGLAAVIVTVTLNAALDRTLTVPNLQLGHRHRASASLSLAGGKGVNIARALKRLDVPVVATGLAGGGTGTRILEELADEAILHDFVRIRDNSRTSTAVVDPMANSFTEIYEWGPHVEQDELDVLREKLRYLSTLAPSTSSSPARCRAASTPPSTPRRSAT